MATNEILIRIKANDSATDIINKLQRRLGELDDSLAKPKTRPGAGLPGAIGNPQRLLPSLATVAQNAARAIADIGAASLHAAGEG